MWTSRCFAECCRQPEKAMEACCGTLAGAETHSACFEPDPSRIVLLRPTMSNIVSGRQIRAARMLVGLTQADLARAAGCHPRSVRYWENKGSNPPTNVASTLDSIEQALKRRGVMAFSTPTPGVR